MVMDISDIALIGNTNAKSQVRVFRTGESKSTILKGIREPAKREIELGVEGIFVREFKESKKTAEVQVTKCNREYFTQNAPKNTFRRTALLEENLEDAALWTHPLTFAGQRFQFKTGMNFQELQEVLKNCNKIATQESERLVRKETEDILKADMMVCKRMDMSIEDYYERYHPERSIFLEEERQSRAMLIAKNHKIKEGTKPPRISAKTKQSIVELRCEAGLQG